MGRKKSGMFWEGVDRKSFLAMSSSIQFERLSKNGDDSDWYGACIHDGDDDKELAISGLECSRQAA
jgi:hypothetical protein